MAESVAALWSACAAAAPEREALTFVGTGGEEERWSFGALDARIAAHGRALAALGVGRGDRVAVHLPNSVAFYALWMAVARLGATLVPTNLRSAPDELRYALERSGAVALAASPAELSRHDGALVDLPRLRLRIACGGEHRGATPLARLADPGPLEDRARAGDDAAILFTSGTTSRPKGVRLTHAACVIAARRMAESTALTVEDRHAVCAPMFHINAQTYSLLPALVAGCPSLLMERFSRTRWLSWVRAHRCTVASLVSSMIRILLEEPPSPRERDHALRLIGCGMRHRALEERLGAPTIGWYGMTETVGVPIVTPLGEREEIPFGAVGRVRAGYQLRLAPGGELEVRGVPGRDLLAGYLDDPEATARALVPDGDAAWLRTGDRARIDGRGNVFYLDRGADFIRRGGENVSPAEVERALLEHPAVREAAAVGLPDPILGQRVAAAILLRPGAHATVEELRRHAAERLADFKVPSEIRLVSELPRATLDKVSRAALRDRW